MLKRLIVLVSVLMFSITPLPATPSSADSLVLESPHITDAVKVGQTAKATLAQWASAADVSYSWIVAGKSLGKAKSLALSVTAAMNHKTLQLVQQAMVSGQLSTRYSNKVIIGKTAISEGVGVAFVDSSKSALMLSGLQVYPSNSKVTLQWYRDGSLVKGATSKTFKLVAKDIYSSLRVAISAQGAGFDSTKALTADFVPDDQSKNYQMIWSDEFNGGAAAGVNSQNWAYQDGDGTAFKNAGWGNNEEQWYLGSQSSLTTDGSLKIDATRDGASSHKCYYGTCNWISSKLVTYKKIGFLYGRLEARIKSSQGQGVWPAFWLLGANIDSRPWPGCGEIDVMELKGAESNTLWGTVHGPNGDIGTTKSLATDISQWHTYAIDWTPNSITWFVDGVQYQRVTKWDYVGASSPAVWVFDHEFYVILNLAMGGNFVGGPTDPALKTANLNIDYVRFYSIDGVGQLIQH
ncbi:MAG: family 16 glycosylhydrolase [Micrococcales bacterium]